MLFFTQHFFFLYRLKDLDDHDKARLAKAKAKNYLESFIVETREKMYADEYEKASTEEEREKIQKSLSEIGDWLEYESDDATTEVKKHVESNVHFLIK